MMSLFVVLLILAVIGFAVNIYINTPNKKDDRK